MTSMMRFRLSFMMFLEYFVWGAWYVTFGTWLSTTLHFNGQQIGLAAGATAIGAMIAPFFVGVVADKYFATEKVLSVLHLAGGVFLAVASTQRSFGAVYMVLLLHCLCFMPTLGLTNSLAFRQIKDPKREFGALRIFGTLGWIFAGLLVGFFALEKTAKPLQIAAAASIALGLYCLTLPHTPPLLDQRANETQRGASLRDSLVVLKEWPVAVFAAASFLICIPLQFYYAFTNLFLNQTGVRDAAGKMTGGQASELLCMLLIPWFFRRLGVKGMLVAGMAAWVARYCLFAYGNADARVWMLWAGILLHGICYDFFFVTGQIYIDHKTSPAMRAAAQGLITFITYGAGMFAGSWLSGAVVEHFALVGAIPPLYNWKAIWLFSAILSMLVLVAFLLTFRDGERLVAGDAV